MGRLRGFRWGIKEAPRTRPRLRVRVSHGVAEGRSGKKRARLDRAQGDIYSLSNAYILSAGRR